jgi:hypothetical protein
MNRNAPVAQLDRALPSEGKGHTFESCRVRQSFLCLQRDMRARTQIPVLPLVRAIKQSEGKASPNSDSPATRLVKATASAVKVPSNRGMVLGISDEWRPQLRIAAIYTR